MEGGAAEDKPTLAKDPAADDAALGSPFVSGGKVAVGVAVVIV
jgi:hypothetical protein